ncbi:Delta protein [Fasciola gigantica]|uniref:Delta protein n=1 Tax=Fasciola gigantica TaxID=46835 RepID=A0A504YYZ1_FASGI|nr:Delta protein [Fasciola gigantica]
MEVRLGVDVRVDVIVRIECAKDFFGDHCEIYCQPYSGLWTCHELTGARICSKPCVHGSCVLTNQSAVCVCTSGWTGEFCKLAVDSSLISSIILPEMPPSIDAGATEHESAYPNLVAESNEQYLPQLLKHNEQPELKTTRNQLTTSSLAISRTHQIHPEENGQSSSVTGSTTTAAKVTQLTDADESAPMNTNELHPIVPVTIVTMSSRLSTELEHSMEEGSNQTASLNSSQYNTWEEHASIVKQAGGFQSDSSSAYMIALITVGVIIIWAVIFLVIALLVYRQRRKNKGSNHSGSLWTNASYDLGPVSVQHSGRLYMLSDGQKYQNASGQAGSVRLSSDFSKNLRIPLNGTSKGPSNGSDGSESVRYTAPPNQTGSRIRFAAPKADPLPPAPKDIPCMTLTDPYDELTYLGEDYAVWETDTDAKRPLTSFR